MRDRVSGGGRLKTVHAVCLTHCCDHPSFSRLQSTDGLDKMCRSNCVTELPLHGSLLCSYCIHFCYLDMAKPCPEVYSRGLFRAQTSCLYRKADGCCLGARFQNERFLTVCPLEPGA